MSRDEKIEARTAGPSPAVGVPPHPYPMPEALEQELADILDYWESLKRRQNNVPFWDDLQLTALREFNDILMTIDVFETPERFRLGVVGRALTARYGAEAESYFIDELARRAPFEYLTSQCSATVQAMAPTFYHHIAMNAHAPDPSKSYLRLLLPLWGEGHVAMLLGAVVMAD